ncbi:polysaccharide deacetylase family protein [Paenibacillus humicola]|uniref:polysaccharide deacetylase family protein n=1 Tax=Paenibacillus humicola TaxID=3110540 RepID=UPI00237BF4B3|nr:polysaccharide deacetylase family protein [Paenibacillus humicola]
MSSRRKIVLLTALVYLFAYGLFYVKDEVAYTHAEAAPSPDHFEIPVLAYHSVSARTDGEYNITPAKFAEQMKTLAQLGYRTVTMAEFDRYMKGTAHPKPGEKLVLLTFDDGYRNVYSVAYPIMRQYGFTAAMFLITSWAGGPSFVTWDQAAALQNAGWDIMAHSETHPHLPLLPENVQNREILGSKQAIESHLGKPAIAFAYPYGNRSGITYRLVRESGFDYAFTFDDGLTDSRQDPFLLKRRIVSGTETLPEFELKLTKQTGEE